MIVDETRQGPGKVGVDSIVLTPAGTGPQAVELFHVSFDVARFDAAWFAQHGISFPPNVARSVEKRQAEFFHGRLCARAALARHGMVDVDIATGPHREPVWPAGVVGSITHSHNIAAAVVMPRCACNGVGIDIEEIVHGSSALAVIDVAMSARELDYLRSLDIDLAFNTLLTLVFSAKESFYKGMFKVVRRVLDFDVIEIIERSTPKRAG